MTLVDLNRAGAALVEIVTKPDMRCALDVSVHTISFPDDRIYRTGHLKMPPLLYANYRPSYDISEPRTPTWTRREDPPVCGLHRQLTMHLQGELRCDVNVSVQRTAPGSPRGTRCEVKNLNGVRFLQAAIGTWSV